MDTALGSLRGAFSLVAIAKATLFGCKRRLQLDRVVVESGYLEMWKIYPECKSHDHTQNVNKSGTKGTRGPFLKRTYKINREPYQPLSPICNNL